MRDCGCKPGSLMVSLRRYVQMTDANVTHKPAGDNEPEVDANRDRAEVPVKTPNEPGLDRQADTGTASPKVEPADEVSEGR